MGPRPHMASQTTCVPWKTRDYLILSSYLLLTSPHPPNPRAPHPELRDRPVLTDNIVPEADGAESDEGEVEGFPKAPALHVAEDHGRQDENDQCPQGQEQSQAQDLQQLGVRVCL